MWVRVERFLAQQPYQYGPGNGPVNGPAGQPKDVAAPFCQCT